MNSAAKRVLRDATRSRDYWNLSDAEKLVWMIERAYQLGRKWIGSNPRAVPRKARAAKRSGRGRAGQGTDGRRRQELETGRLPEAGEITRRSRPG